MIHITLEKNHEKPNTTVGRVFWKVYPEISENLSKLPEKYVSRSSLLNKAGTYQSIALLENETFAKVNYETKFFYKTLGKNFHDI